MTNFEKYQKEILNIVSKQSLAVKEGKPASCDETNCNECMLEATQCVRELIKWLYAEAKLILTAKERAFCEIVGEGYISRDKDGELFYSQSDKPYKDDEIWVVDCNDYITLPGDLLEFITWEDEEPWAVKELLKLEVEE